MTGPRISSVREDTPIDFVYLPNGMGSIIPRNVKNHVKTVHRVMIRSGNVWIGDPVATGAPWQGACGRTQCPTSGTGRQPRPRGT